MLSPPRQTTIHQIKIIKKSSLLYTTPPIEHNQV